MGVTIFRGLHSQLRPQAAQLYWEAFGGKLGRVLGPDERALRFFQRVIRGDLCFSAVGDGGELIGLAGYKTPTGSFAGGSWEDLTEVYGRIGGRWRGSVLWALGREVDNDRFLIDGICVGKAHRGKGVGSMLLAALYHEAAERGYGSVRLDVVQDNFRARALYERQGFRAVRTEELGMLRFLFGFASSTTMVRPLS
ncbi:GNAT family N-acetyltransferase [Tabrizicola sp.]|uniref:GNAT family N-acetyltransferase n=1 Tax=Tabrizicola sp. TaxID=2005166 RepID=UPI00273745A1|nr:GNAT family N-acetyltransferase [Tabrizicola sp.]MDP3195897.1 GNAT family N-acetyltransferase [Tabrizicola sp.]